MLSKIPSQIALIPREFWEILTEIFIDFSSYLMQKPDEFRGCFFHEYSCKKIELCELILKPWNVLPAENCELR